MPHVQCASATEDGVSLTLESLFQPCGLEQQSSQQANVSRVLLRHGQEQKVALDWREAVRPVVYFAEVLKAVRSVADTAIQLLIDGIMVEFP